MTDSTYTNVAAPNMTLEGLAEVKRTLMEKYPFAGMEPITSPFIPEGFHALIGHNCMAVITPEGRVLSFERRDMFSQWKPKL